MDKVLRLEVHGSVLLVTGMVMSLVWSFFVTQWWNVVFGYLAVFFLVEAIWHYVCADRLRHGNASH
ncbi:MAG: hypothetical protein ACFFDU_10365 [Candidatus Thorarchaeota archaeon]